MEFSSSAVWLLVGAVLFALEVYVFPTMVLAFVGCGAVTTGVVLLFGAVESVSQQFSVFFGSTIFWAVALWRPLKNFYGPGGGGYEDIIGHIATVGKNGLEMGKKGEVMWSGSVWNARLSSDSKEARVDAQTEVKILAIDAGVLIVAPIDK